MDGKLLGKIVLVVVVGGAVFWWKMSTRSDASKQIHDDIKKVVVAMKEYPENKQNLDRWLEMSHEAAFDAAYDIGGRRQSASFDDEKYIDTFFEKMRMLATSAKKEALAKALEELKVTFINESAPGAMNAGTSSMKK